MSLTRPERCYLRLIRLSFSPKRTGFSIKGSDRDGNAYHRMLPALKDKGYINHDNTYTTLRNKAFQPEAI